MIIYISPLFSFPENPVRSFLALLLQTLLRRLFQVIRSIPLLPMERGKAILGGNSEMCHGEVEFLGMLEFLGRDINGVRIHLKFSKVVFWGGYCMIFSYNPIKESLFEERDGH